MVNAYANCVAIAEAWRPCPDQIRYDTGQRGIPRSTRTIPALIPFTPTGVEDFWTMAEKSRVRPLNVSWSVKRSPASPVTANASSH